MSKMWGKIEGFIEDIPSTASPIIYYLEVAPRKYGENSTELMQK
jgi:hypothetical protein